MNLMSYLSVSVFLLFGFIFELKYLHTLFIPHSMHFGLRAVHTYRPCSISQWCAIGILSVGMCLVSIRSVCSGVLELEVSPILLATLNTWVSTAIVGLLYITEAITLAVLRPTPCRRCSWSMSSGTIPPKSFTKVRAIAAKCRLLLFGYDTDLMYSKILAINVEKILINSLIFMM